MPDGSHPFALHTCSSACSMATLPLSQWNLDECSNFSADGTSLCKRSTPWNYRHVLAIIRPTACELLRPFPVAPASPCRNISWYSKVHLCSYAECVNLSERPPYRMSLQCHDTISNHASCTPDSFPILRSASNLAVATGDTRSALHTWKPS